MSSVTIIIATAPPGGGGGGPTLTIGNASRTEGNAGSANLVFTVTLSQVYGQNVAFDYATADGTATAGVDYTAVSGTRTINAGSLTTTIDVPILGDTLAEANETFSLSISNVRFV